MIKHLCDICGEDIITSYKKPSIIKILDFCTEEEIFYPHIELCGNCTKKFLSLIKKESH